MLSRQQAAALTPWRGCACRLVSRCQQHISGMCHLMLFHQVVLDSLISLAEACVQLPFWRVRMCPPTPPPAVSPLEPHAASTSLATSPPRTSPHARLLVSTATPHTATNTKRATAIPPRRSHRSEPEPRTVRVLRVTPAPAPSCVCRCSRGGCPVKSGRGCEGAHSSACGGVVLGPLSCCQCVYQCHTTERGAC